MSHCCQLPEVRGYSGQVRDLTIDWLTAARRLREDILTSVVWSRVNGDAVVGSGSLNDMYAVCRFTVGTVDSDIQAVATFSTGQTLRQLVRIRVD